MGVKGRRVVGDPVMLGLLDWSAGGRKGELIFPVAMGEPGQVVRWEDLPGDAVAVADGLFPGFAELVREAELSSDQLAVAYPDGWGGDLYRPFHREMLRRKWAGKPDGVRPVVIYHHVPKCAGMSMFHHLNANLAWNDELVHLDGRARADVLAAGVVPFDWKDDRELARIEVLFGHDVSLASAERLAGRERILVTCLRDPAERMVSHYNWEMHQRELAGQLIPEFGPWHAKQGRNWMTRWFGRAFFGLEVDRMEERTVFDLVCEGLESFAVVGMTERFEESMRPVTDRLGLPRVGTATNVAGESYPKRMRLSSESRWRAELAEAHPLDVALVERWAGAGKARDFSLCSE